MKLTDAPAEFIAENEEERDFLRSLANDLIDMLESTERAMAEKFNAQMFDLDEGNDLWSLLPAKVRTAIKRGGEKKSLVACLTCGGVGTHTRNCTVGGKFA
jgi:hypothetical protein